MKVFNTTAVCIPEEHYMVDLSERVKEIKKLVDAKKYFTINRARQYGKTTTLAALDTFLSDQYDVISLDFQDLTDGSYLDESSFVKGLAQVMCDTRDSIEIPLPDEFYDAFQALAAEDKTLVINDIFRIFDRWCKQNAKPIVLIIDEVDTATNNQVFLDFLGKLRSNYLKRAKNPRYRTFHSVILAGVTDVKHLKSKIRPEEEGKENSPWNISADFNIDMSLSEAGIKGMLDEYEADHHTGMNTAEIAAFIWQQTSGYPFLVSRICQLIDERVCQTMKPVEAWTREGVNAALRLLLAENNTLFQTITKNLKNFPRLRNSLRSILMEGTKLAYNTDQDDIVQMEMYGLIKNDHNTVRVANTIFETRLYNLFLSDVELENNVFCNTGTLNRNRFIKDKRLDMVAVLNGFIETYTQVFGPLTDRFKEKDGREYFLLYLKPIINGTGNFYIEAQTRDQRRTDVIVDFLGEQFIIELKIWKGASYNEKGEKQICEYLERFGLKTGYMLTFNFNKNKEQGIKEVVIDDMTIHEATL